MRHSFNFPISRGEKEKELDDLEKALRRVKVDGVAVEQLNQSTRQKG